MTVTPFALVLVAFIIYFIIRDWNKGLETFFKHIFWLTAFVSMFTNLGFFLKIGASDLGYETFLSLFLMGIGIAYILLNGKFDRKIARCGLLFVGSILIGIVLFAIFPYTNGLIRVLSQWDGYVIGTQPLDYSPSIGANTFVYLISAIKLPVILSIAFMVFDRDEWKKAIFGVFSILIDLVLLYGVFEIVAKKLLNINPVQLLLNPFFGVSANSFSLMDRMQGLYKEASHYAAGLFLIGIVLIYRIKLLKKESLTKRVMEYCKLALVLFLMMASTSFTWLLYAFLLLLLLVYVCTNIRSSVLLLATGAILMVGVVIITNQTIMRAFGMESYYNRVMRLLQSIASMLGGGTAVVSSEGVRFTSIFAMVRIVLRRPLFGVGLGVTDAHSTIFSILGNCGLVGLILWGILLLKFANFGKQGKFFIAILFLALAFVGGIGEFSMLKYPVILAIASACSSVRQKNERKKELQTQ